MPSSASAASDDSGDASPLRVRAVAASPRVSRAVPLVRGPRTTTIRTRPTAVQGTLALEWALPGAVDAVPAVPAELRLVTRDTGHDLDTDPAVAARASSRAELPDPGPWTAQLVQAVVEVLAHERPRQQLARWLTPEVYAEIGRFLAAAGPRPAATRGRVRRTVSSTHVFEPADGVVEATAVVTGGRRARAVAVRLEGWDGRWRCVKLAVL